MVCSSQMPGRRLSSSSIHDLKRACLTRYGVVQHNDVQGTFATSGCCSTHNPTVCNRWLRPASIGYPADVYSTGRDSRNHAASPRYPSGYTAARATATGGCHSVQKCGRLYGSGRAVKEVTVCCNLFSDPG